VIASTTSTTATVTRITRVLSSTDVDASTARDRPGTPLTTVVPPGSSTFTVRPNESRRSASSD
jgi:hypothetical protein